MHTEESNNQESYGAVVVREVTIIGDNVEDTALGQEIRKMGEKVEHEHDLTQLLGVSIRGILPYAENELNNLREAHKRDADPDVLDEVQRASVRVQRAQQALDRLNLSPLQIDNCADEEFDDKFEIRFDLDED